MARDIGYCEASGRQTASAKWERVFCGECHDPMVLVNADGKLRKHFRHLSKEELVERGHHRG